ncbi:MAG: hypothetical protein IKS85_02225 [Lachnospiraceae bacterium]|nr:hypothetical protein [Lachnospiraceae bacterium]
MEKFVGELGRLTIFMICGQLIAYFRPNASYEKYFRVLLNLLILLQFLAPLRRLLPGEEAWEKGLTWSLKPWMQEETWPAVKESAGACEQEEVVPVRFEEIEDVEVTITPILLEEEDEP